LAVVPTWIAIKEHTPVGSDKNYEYGGNSEEERSNAEGSDGDAKDAVVVKSDVKL
jgi:hypothetical protein